MDITSSMCGGGGSWGPTTKMRHENIEGPETRDILGHSHVMTFLISDRDRDRTIEE